MTKKRGLPHTVVRQLLTDIEESGKTLRQFNLSALLNSLSKGWRYGDLETETGRRLRRQVQQKFGNLKSKTLDQYVACLEKFQVSPGEATQLELRKRELNQQTTAIDVGDSTDEEEEIPDEKPEPEEKLATEGKRTLEASILSSSGESQASSSSNEEELSSEEKSQVTPVTEACRRLSFASIATRSHINTLSLTLPILAPTVLRVSLYFLLALRR